MNDINALRKHLFDTIEGVKNKTMSIEQAKAISDISQVVINSAKIEVEYAKVVGAELSSNFLPEFGANGVTHPAPGVTRHRLK